MESVPLSISWGGLTLNYKDPLPTRVIHMAGKLVMAGRWEFSGG